MSTYAPKRTRTPSSPAAASANSSPEKASSAAKAKNAQPAFPWLQAPLPEGVRASFPAKFLAMHRREIHERASLLRRLGYSQDEVRNRLESYELWEYEPFHSSPLRAEVQTLVATVFAPASPRTTTLAPGS